MRPLVDTEPPAAALFYAMVALWLASELRIMVRNRGGTGENLDRGSRLWVVALIVTGMGAAWGVARLPVGGIDGWWPVVAGILLALCGMGLRQWAVATLGALFTTAVEVQKDHQVITRGPYALVRHPSYSGTLLTVLGASLALGSWIACLVALVFAVAGLAQRINVEEDALASQLGTAWTEYSQTRRRLIPLVW